MKRDFVLFVLLLMMGNNLSAQKTALYFDGKDDYVLVPGTTKLNSFTKITLETWVYSDNFNTSPCADCAPIIWNQGKAYRFGTGNGRAVSFSLQSPSSTMSLSSSVNLKTSTWHHIAGTYDGSKMRIYIDGVATDSLSTTIAITYGSTTADVWIADPQTGWGGILEETRIWDYARSRKEILEGMIKKYSSSTTGLVLSYGYEDGVAYKNNTSVTSIKDNSNFKNDGSPKDFALMDTVSNFVLGRTYCDTVVYSKFSISQCVKYTLPSKKRTVTKSGSYNDTIVSYKGCDSVITIAVTILNPSTGSVSYAACDSFRNPINGAIYKRSGKYNVTTRNAAGCDSVISFNITIYKKDTTYISYNSCDFVKLNNGKTVVSSGIYVDTLKGKRGCDSIIIHTVTIRKKTLARRTLTVCLFVLCPSNKQKVFYKPGIYYDTLENSVKCDSVIEYTVVTATSTGTLNVKACTSYTSPSKKYTYTKSGTYQDTLFAINRLGCDSFITINLTINSPQKKNLQITQCRSYTVPSGNRVINQSQIVTDYIKSKDGCDSIEYTIDVTINNANTGIMRTGNTLSSVTSNSSALFRWMDCDVNYAPINGATGKQFTPGKNGNYALEVTEYSCIDTSNCYAFTLVGIKDVPALAVSLSSNPSRGTFALRSVYPIHGVKITLSDIRGRQVKQWEIPSLKEQEFDAEVSPGLCYLKIESDEGYKVLPILFK